ncbi:5322_t:CDS:2 [Diversispora eburnea]|uniref:5322_t:CDS:1 n=1 Tax=Diversispora eburnea TaxID=1213867 RepID=A0A9N8ZYY3_9GLOM|nr:5322_t:CDS:2 [Diversispora eburnea]
MRNNSAPTDQETLRTLDGKMKKLQNDGLGETEQASSLSTEEIIHILDHKTMQPNTNEGLTRRKS